MGSYPYPTYPYDNTYTPDDLYRFSADVAYSVDIEDLDGSIVTYTALAPLFQRLGELNVLYDEKLAEYNLISSENNIACQCRCADFPNCVMECKAPTDVQLDIAVELEQIDALRREIMHAISNFECIVRDYRYDISGYNSYRTTMIDNEQICHELELP